MLKILIEATSGPLELGGGRVSDEWLPALEHYQSASLFNQLFGIGAGTPFITGNRELRTYIHNYPLYVLVYQGAVGLLLVAGLLLFVGIRLLRTYLRTNDPILLASIAMVVAAQSSALFFAVHKLVSVNLMMVVVLLVVLNRPDELLPNRTIQNV